MYRVRRRDQGGFTLVELMLAVGFVGSLLVLIALIIVQIMGLYNKGLTLKEVNEVSRIVVRDMQQGISGADAFRLQYVKDDKPTYATTLQEAVNPGGSNSQVDGYGNDAGGRLCTGVYSYVWTTAGAYRAWRDDHSRTMYTSSSTGDNPNRWHEQGASMPTSPPGGYPIQFVTHTNTDGSTEQIPVRFMKRLDTAKSLCRLPAGDAVGTTTHDRRLGNEDEYTNAFGTGNNELVLYDFSIQTPLKPTSDQRTDDLTAVSTFYYVKMTLGTQNGDENEQNGLIASTEVCKPPADATQNEGEYCAVNKIDFVARTGRIGG